MSELCRREGVSPTQYYAWEKKLLGSAGKIFEEKATKPDADRERPERELSRMKDVVAEITAENPADQVRLSAVACIRLVRLEGQ